MSADDSRSGLVKIEDIGGHQGTIERSVTGLPAGVAAEIVPESLLAGKTAVLTLTTEDAGLGESTVTVTGTMDQPNRQRFFTLAVGEYVSDMLLPIVTHKAGYISNGISAV